MAPDTAPKELDCLISRQFRCCLVVWAKTSEVLDRARVSSQSTIVPLEEEHTAVG